MERWPFVKGLVPLRASISEPVIICLIHEFQTLKN